MNKGIRFTDAFGQDAVGRILGDRTRIRTRRFTELQPHNMVC